jgi:hypothetical protein
MRLLRSLCILLILGLSQSARAVSDAGPFSLILPGPANKQIDKKKNSLDSKTVDKVDAVFAAVFGNDDKKAKLAYGRGYRFMPEFMQFALDLRFRNYEHALTLLPEVSESKEEIEFWNRIIGAKPAKLAGAICEDLKKHPEFPSQPLETETDESVWAAHLIDLGVKLAEAQKPLDRSPTKLDQVLEKLTCQQNDTFPPTWQCEPMTPEVRAEVTNHSFFDNLHNMQRRDIRFVKANYRHHIKLLQYRRYINPVNLYKFHFAIEATNWEGYNSFSRRYKGFARDMRTEDLIGRVMGDLMLDDKKDMAIARRLHSIVYSNPVLALATRIEWDLVNCELPPLPAR